jgi:hypothetical protein
MARKLKMTNKPGHREYMSRFVENIGFICLLSWIACMCKSFGMENRTTTKIENVVV